jgi:hypothetical protein
MPDTTFTPTKNKMPAYGKVASEIEPFLPPEMATKVLTFDSQLIPD